MLPRSLVLWALVVLPGTAAPAAGADAEAAADDEALRAAHLPTDGPGLAAFFRRRTPNDETYAHLQELIAQLGSDSYAEREEASAELETAGPAAAGLLRQATRHPDLEVRRRARQALSEVLRDSDPEVLSAAARALARRRPAEAVEVLLAYVPHVEDAGVADEVCSALASAGARDGKADPRLTAALRDAVPAKRGAAGAALVRCRAQLPAVRRLLRDPDPLVRRRVALALVEAGEKPAVATLIALLTELPPAEAERVEEVLAVLASGRGPPGDLDGDEAARRKYRDAWAAWWASHGPGIDLARVEGLGHTRGYTLLVQLDLPGNTGCAQELDAGGRPRWQIKGLQYPIDAQVLDARRVLVVEYSGRRVTERDHKGEVLWQVQADSYPVSARRLPNGNTFIVTRTRVYEVDRTGAEVWALDPRQGVAAACPLPDGQVGVLQINGEFLRLDRAGKVLKSFRVGRILRSVGTHMEVLPDGHVLVPFYTANCVVEYDEDGKAVWTGQAFRPTSVHRRANGHTLICSRMSDVIVELDRKGREVWSYRCEGRAMRALRR